MFVTYSLFILNLLRVTKVAAHFQKKNKMFIYSFNYANEETVKTLKK